jgi:hypothetical protein
METGEGILIINESERGVDQTKKALRQTTSAYTAEVESVERESGVNKDFRSFSSSISNLLPDWILINTETVGSHLSKENESFLKRVDLGKSSKGEVRRYFIPKSGHLITINPILQPFPIPDQAYPESPNFVGVQKLVDYYRGTLIYSDGYPSRLAAGVYVKDPSDNLSLQQIKQISGTINENITTNLSKAQSNRLNKLQHSITILDEKVAKIEEEYALRIQNRFINLRDAILRTPKGKRIADVVQLEPTNRNYENNLYLLMREAKLVLAPTITRKKWLARTGRKPDLSNAKEVPLSVWAAEAEAIEFTLSKYTS